mmetsp:Transcript_24182/g.41608  ORF Transcript_24182/g.41608 Transcript_24182/m.41608 type:complete len:88 (+) Transcript_24182:98-361(+)
MEVMPSSLSHQVGQIQRSSPIIKSNEGSPVPQQHQTADKTQETATTALHCETHKKKKKEKKKERNCRPRLIEQQLWLNLFHFRLRVQ